jgi:hypothetical protein
VAAANLKARALEIQKNTLLKQLQKLLAQLENPLLTAPQLEQVKKDLALAQKKYNDLGIPGSAKPS